MKSSQQYAVEIDYSDEWATEEATVTERFTLLPGETLEPTKPGRFDHMSDDEILAACEDE